MLKMYKIIKKDKDEIIFNDMSVEFEKGLNLVISEYNKSIKVLFECLIEIDAIVIMDIAKTLIESKSDFINGSHVYWKLKDKSLYKVKEINNRGNKIEH